MYINIHCFCNVLRIMDFNTGTLCLGYQTAVIPVVVIPITGGGGGGIHKHRGGGGGGYYPPSGGGYYPPSGGCNTCG